MKPPGMFVHLMADVGHADNRHSSISNQIGRDKAYTIKVNNNKKKKQRTFQSGI